eukprot:281778_1
MVSTNDKHREFDITRLYPAAIGLSVTFGIAAYKSFKQYRSWKRKHFPNVLQISLNTILQTKKHPNKYRLSVASVYQESLTNVIYNEPAIKTLQRAWGKCTKTDPIIRFQSNQDGQAIWNAITRKFESQFANFWINRSNSIGKNIELNESNINYDNILSEIYIFGLVNTNKNKSFRDLFHEEYQHYDQENKHEWSQDLNQEIEQVVYIRGILIADECIKYFIDKYGDKINEMTESEWQLLLDCDDVIKYSVKDPMILFAHQRRWMIVRKTIQEYIKQEKIFNEQIRYGQPLCLIHLPSYQAHSLRNVNEKPLPLLNVM